MSSNPVSCNDSLVETNRVVTMAEKVEVGSDLPITSEPVKVEEPPSDGTSSENRPTSPEPDCAICLSGPKNKSFTDSCFHQFCFSCLLEWSKVKAECPLCKQPFRCIIHNIRSLDDYDKYQVQANPDLLSTSSLMMGLNQMINDQTERFRYRTTASYPRPAPENFQFLFDAFSSNDLQYPRYEAPGNFVLPSSRRQSTRRNGFSGTSEFRRNIYRLNLWVRPTPDVSGRYRECSPEFYRTNEAATHRLVPWLNREINVLMPNNDEPMKDYVMSLILRHIYIYSIRSPGFYHRLIPYFGSYTRHFLHEFYSFAISQFDLIGYDLQVQYVSYDELGNSADEGAEEEFHDVSSSSDNDSDIQIVDVSSSSSQTVTTIDQGHDSDCVVVDEVNPANRPIELIDVLSDSDSEETPDIQSVSNPASNTINVSTLTNSSSDEDFFCIDEFRAVKNTALPKLKLRDLKEIVENPYLPSTSNGNTENPRSTLKLKSSLRKSRVSSQDTSLVETTDSGEEWRPTGSRRKKKKKKKSKECCCEKLKKQLKNESLRCIGSESDSQSEGSDVEINVCDLSDSPKCCEQASTSENSRKLNCSSKKSKSKKTHVTPQDKRCKYEQSSISSDEDLSAMSDVSFSSSEDEFPQRQLRNNSKKSQQTSEDHTYDAKKSSHASKRKQAASHLPVSKLEKNKGKKRHKSHHNLDPPISSDSDSTESYERSNSTESKGKPVPKKSKSKGKKLEPVRNSVIVTREDDSPESTANRIVPKTEMPSNSDGSLESTNSSSERPKLRSVVRVVTRKNKHSRRLPRYEIVSFTVREHPSPKPSTSRS